MFYHRTSKRPTEPADHGTKEKNTYGIETTHTGHKKVIVTGKTNTYDKIQEHAESTKIENIVRRYKQGDLNALNVTQGIYTDVVGFPTSLAEAQREINKLEQSFEKLPLTIRKAYRFSAEQFIADFGSENFNNIMGIKKETEVKPNEETPKAD